MATLSYATRFISQCHLLSLPLVIDHAPLGFLEFFITFVLFLSDFKI